MNFKAKIFKNKIKVPSNIINEIGLENGDLIDIDIERVEE